MTATLILLCSCNVSHMAVTSEYHCLIKSLQLMKVIKSDVVLEPQRREIFHRQLF